MPIDPSKCVVVEVQEGTPGGKTYWVVKNDDPDNEHALCYRRTNKRGGRCSMVAGYGTDHHGTGACKFHGGCAGRHPITALHANMSKAGLQGRIVQYMTRDRGQLLDLTYEISAIRVLFQEFMDRFPNPEDKRFGIELGRATQMIGTIGSLLDKVSRIEARSTITAAQVLYLRATVADLLLKYVSDPERRSEAVKELAFRIGSGEMIDA